MYVSGVEFIVSLIYHSPTASHVTNNMFVEYLLSLLSQLKTKHLPLIVGGDLNLNLLNPYNLAYIHLFINGMFELNLIPAINIPTKVNVENLVTRYSIIDQFWVSSTIDIANACVIPTDLTDHFLAGLTVNLGFHSLRDKPTHTYSKRPLSDAGKNAFRIFLSNIDVSFHENHNLNMTSYMNDLMGSYNTAFPLKKIQKKPPNCVPWISERLKLCIRKKSKLYKLYVSGRVSRLAYTSFRNRLTAVLRRSKRLYYVKLFYNAGFASKQIWHVINSIIVKKKCQKLECLEVNGTSLTGLPLVNYINRYFASAALTVTRGLTPPLDYPFLTPPVLNTCFFYSHHPYRGWQGNSEFEE